MCSLKSTSHRKGKKSLFFFWSSVLFSCASQAKIPKCQAGANVLPPVWRWIPFLPEGLIDTFSIKTQFQKLQGKPNNYRVNLFNKNMVTFPQLWTYWSRTNPESTWELLYLILSHRRWMNGSNSILLWKVVEDGAAEYLKSWKIMLHGKSKCFMA